MNEDEKFERRAKARNVLSLFRNVAKERGFTGTLRLYRSDTHIQSQLRLNKSTYGDNRYLLAASLYLFRECDNRKVWHEGPDIYADYLLLAPDHGRAIREALNAETPLKDDERSVAFSNFLDEGAEPWFRSLDSAEKIRSFIFDYNVEDVEKRKRGLPFRRIFEYLLSPEEREALVRAELER